jgi:hypothetical protein
VKFGIAYFEENTFKCKLVSRKAKLKLCWTVIRPVIMYASEMMEVVHGEFKQMMNLITDLEI